MARDFNLVIVSDIHYAAAEEKARGFDYEFKAVKNPATRLFLIAFRKFIWLRHPSRRNDFFDRFLEEVPQADLTVANGDLCCDSSFLGVSDDAAFQSARECMDKLAVRFGSALRVTIGDHELGKSTLVGGRGGMRLASFHRATQGLHLQPFWMHRIDRYVLLGVTSSLVALPSYSGDILSVERPEWEQLRGRHMAEIAAGFEGLDKGDRVLLFCHDPTALPFLWHEEAVRRRVHQIEQTIVGHLHSRMILWKSRLLAGMPTITCFGHPIKRITGALRKARGWKPFRIRLCPSLTGIELFKDGGYYQVTLDRDGVAPARFEFKGLRV